MSGGTELLEQAIDQAVRDRFVKRRSRKLGPLVRRAELQIGALFRRQGNITVAALRQRKQAFKESAEGDSVDAAFDEATMVTIGDIRDWSVAWGGAAFTEAIQATGILLSIDSSFDLPFPEAERYGSRHAAELIRGLNQTSREELRALVTRSISEGWSYERLAKEIHFKFEDFAKSRAHLVAVTELGNAYEEGGTAVGRTMQAAGIAVEKAWLTVGDDRVDPNCRANESAGWIPFDEPFPSGHMHPLDHPGCRCAGLTRRAEE